MNISFIDLRNTAKTKLHTDEIAELTEMLKTQNIAVLREKIYYETLNAIDRIRKTAGHKEYAHRFVLLSEKTTPAMILDLLDINGAHEHYRQLISDSCAFIIEREEMIAADNKVIAECPYLNTTEPLVPDDEMYNAARYCLKQMPELYNLKLHAAEVIIPVAKAILTSDGYDKVVAALKTEIDNCNDAINSATAEGNAAVVGKATQRLNRLKQIEAIVIAENSEEIDGVTVDKEGVYHTRLKGVTYGDRQSNLRNANTKAPLHTELTTYQGDLSIAVKTETNLELGFLPAGLAAKIEKMYTKPAVTIPEYAIDAPSVPGQSYGCRVAVKVEEESR